MGYIDKYSFKCLLGKCARDITELDGIYSWKVSTRQNFCADRQLTEDDLPYLKSITPTNFHYLSEDNINFLKQHFSLKKSKDTGIVVDIRDMSLIGHSIKNVRYSFNRCSKNKFEILDNFKDIQDVKKMVDQWGESYRENYFRNFAPKNLYFYSNNFHKDCINIFIYDSNELVAYSTLSPPKNGMSAYIIGKSLYKKYYGLSEFADVTVYRKAQAYGTEKVNMGGSFVKSLIFYKSKFPGAEGELEFDGTLREVLNGR